MTTTVSARLSYFTLPADGSKPWQNINADPVTGEQDRNWEPTEHLVEVEDLRAKLNDASLDTNGFQFFRRPFKHTSFDNDEGIRREYYSESIDFIKQTTGASRVVVFDHTIRRHRPGQADDSPENRQPVSRVHVDQTPESARARVYRHVPDDADKLVKKRYQIINLWRPITHPAHAWPLALCDYKTVDAKRDLVSMTLRYPDGHDGETYGVLFDPQQRWKYVSGLAPEEGVLIKCYDSKDDGEIAIFTPHTAFEDPTTPTDAPKRESVELRALVFYD